jgi:hypothetical protein
MIRAALEKGVGAVRQEAHGGAIVGEEAGELECHRCRGSAGPVYRPRGKRRCPACGLPMVTSMRDCEADAWRVLYGGSPPGVPAGRA